MYIRAPYSVTNQEFVDLTKNFDVEDWRTVRNENYWWVEGLPGFRRPRSTYEKLDLIRHYVNKGVPK